VETTTVSELFAGLRVSDVRDGMDWAGLHAKGSVSPEIAPLFAGASLCGPAHTVRHRLSEKVVPPMSPDDYTNGRTGTGTRSFTPTIWKAI